MGLQGRVRQVLRSFGLDVRRHDPEIDRPTFAAALAQLASRGVAPGTVFDVGAADGTPWLYRTWPEAHHVLIEPLAEFEPALQATATALRSAEVLVAAAGPERREVTINVHPDLVGSSLLLEDEDSDVNGVPRQVQQIRLDELADRPGPYLIKADTQGYELAVVEGAEGLLPETQAIVLEVSLFDFFEGGADLAEVVADMRAREFYAYDVLEPRYRPLDGALAQVDVVFAPDGPPLRAVHAYASAEQRARLTQELLRHHGV